MILYLKEMHLMLLIIFLYCASSRIVVVLQGLTNLFPASQAVKIFALQVNFTYSLSFPETC